MGAPDESIDPFSGTLHIVHADVVLPGKGGLDLKIVRSYSSKIWGRTDDGSLASLIPESENSPLGYGWSLHMGRIKNPNATGGPTSPCSGDYPVLEMPDGSARVFYRVSASDAHLYTSRDYWRMETGCSFLSGAGTCVWSTDGVRYEFSSAFANSYYYGPSTLVWPTSRIVDPFGNSIVITYTPDQTGTIDTITDTYGRQLVFHYSGSKNVADGKRISSIDVGANTYTFNYQSYATIGGGSLNPRRFLASVVPPAGRAYVYEYAISAPASQNQYALSSITYPHGGKAAYVYDSTPFSPYVGNPVPFAVVTSKTLTDRGGAVIGTWSYAYTAPSPPIPPATGTPMNVTTIARPDGKSDVYTMYGFGATAPGSFWQVGLTQQVWRACSGTSSTSCLEVETLGWDQRSATPVSNSIYSAPGYNLCAGPTPPVDNSVYAPALATRTVQRDGTTYSTTFSNWDAYGQARSVSESGQLARTTTWTYFYKPTNNQSQTLNLVRGRPLSQTVTAGDAYVNSWTYNGPGFARDSETRSGVTTTFGYWTSDPDGAGNLNTVTNAIGKTLTLSGYRFGLGYGTPTTLDFNGVFTYSRTASWEGRILSQTDGRNNTTAYAYDGIGRLKQLTPPAPNEATTYTYDDVTGATVAAQRGPRYTVTTTFDGFGRPVAMSDTLGVLTSRKYDAVGRQWFKSAPYDATTGEVGEKLDFDGLGRVLTLTKACRGATTPATACTGADKSTVTNVYQSSNCVQTTEERGPDNLVTRRCFSSFGSPDEQRLTSMTDAAGKAWAYSYTAIGNPKTVTAPLAAGNRSYGYDTKQFPWWEISPELGVISGDANGASLRYGRNAIGQMTSRGDARGVSWSYDLTTDPLSRLRGIIYGSGSADNMAKTYQTGSSNVASVTSTNGGTFAYPTYDELDRLRAQTWDFGGVRYSTSYTYDAAGCLRTIGYPTGSTVTQSCDDANRVTQVLLNGATIVDTIAYHPSGQPKGMTFGNSKATNIVYDDRARAKTVSSPGVMGLAYTYDGMDNVMTFDDSAVSGAARSMTYDPLNRLWTATGASIWGTAAYDYDALGNRKLKSVGSFTANYTYDPTTNRLASVSGSESTVFHYDGAGNMAAGYGKTFTWDLTGHLASAPTEGATYLFDGIGRRAKKQKGARGTVYHYDVLGRLIAETLPGGQKLRDYIYVGNRLVAIDGRP